MTKVNKVTRRNELLDRAKLSAEKKPQQGVNEVVTMLNQAKDDAEVKAIMDGASARGFFCEFYPVGGGIGIRVEWRKA